MALAHAMVVSAFHMFSRQTPDQELGAHIVDVQQRHHLVERLTRRIEPLDDQVRLEPLPTTAA